ncbi:uncharacterized protein LOC120330766 [Styela clava]
MATISENKTKTSTSAYKLTKLIVGKVSQDSTTINVELGSGFMSMPTTESETKLPTTSLITTPTKNENVLSTANTNSMENELLNTTESDTPEMVTPILNQTTLSLPKSEEDQTKFVSTSTTESDIMLTKPHQTTDITEEKVLDTTESDLEQTTDYIYGTWMTTLAFEQEESTKQIDLSATSTTVYTNKPGEDDKITDEAQRTSDSNVSNETTKDASMIPTTTQSDYFVVESSETRSSKNIHTTNDIPYSTKPTYPYLTTPSPMTSRHSQNTLSSVTDGTISPYVGDIIKQMDKTTENSSSLPTTTTRADDFTTTRSITKTIDLRYGPYSITDNIPTTNPTDSAKPTNPYLETTPLPMASRHLQNTLVSATDVNIVNTSLHVNDIRKQMNKTTENSSLLPTTTTSGGDFTTTRMVTKPVDLQYGSYNIPDIIHTTMQTDYNSETKLSVKLNVTETPRATAVTGTDKPLSIFPYIENYLRNQTVEQATAITSSTTASGNFTTTDTTTQQINVVSLFKKLIKTPTTTSEWLSMTPIPNDARTSFSMEYSQMTQHDTKLQNVTSTATDDADDTPISTSVPLTITQPIETIANFSTASNLSPFRYPLGRTENLTTFVDGTTSTNTAYEESQDVTRNMEYNITTTEKSTTLVASPATEQSINNLVVATTATTNKQRDNMSPTSNLTYAGGFTGNTSTSDPKKQTHIDSDHSENTQILTTAISSTNASKLIGSVTDNATSFRDRPTTSTAKYLTTPQNYCAFRYNGNCFWLVQKALTYFAGRKLCLSRDGAPANIYTRQHYLIAANYIRGVISNTFYSNIWLGMQIDLKTKRIIYMNSNQKTYANWFPGQPSSATKWRRLYIHVLKNKTSNVQGMVVYSPKSILTGVLCQKKIPTTASTTPMTRTSTTTMTTQRTKTEPTSMYAKLTSVSKRTRSPRAKPKRVKIETTTTKPVLTPVIPTAKVENQKRLVQRRDEIQPTNATKLEPTTPPKPNLCQLEFNGICYWLIVNDVSYDDGERQCKKYFGSAANIYSRKHYNFASNYVRKMIPASLNSLDVWLGLRILSSMGTVFLTDWKTAPYLRWFPKQPSLEREKKRIYLHVKKLRSSMMQGMASYQPSLKVNGILCQISKRSIPKKYQ